MLQTVTLLQEVTKIYPEYSKINLLLRGYDYVVLEKYQSFTHKMAKVFRFNVANRSVQFISIRHSFFTLKIQIDMICGMKRVTSEIQGVLELSTHPI